MSTITKEFTKEQLQQIIETDHVQCGEASALARIALASLEAEPYGYVHKSAYEKTGSCGLSNDREAYRDISTHIAVYTAPPAPVSVPDEDLLHMAASAIEDLLSNKDRSGAGVWADVPAKLRRAAMLQGAEPVQATTLREWTNEQCLEFLSVAFRHNEISGDIEFDDIRLGVRFALAAAPQQEVKP
ncbi:hypothetical protein L423_03204 [Enterobacter roggenkampii]|uniref:hypothetical protein n=1 Tax=Enterobacter roggenkampii TaxID=1812935 RepID=UPI0003BE451C|nr:hypothetical protein [Enterobacter roggenkampii]ESL75527.1 hypothetical protein L423_03204 [Enterobacter roggenkampii]